MQSQLTESEAWAAIAEVFAHAIRIKAPNIASYYGICRQAFDLPNCPTEVRNMITNRAIPKKKPYFRWPRDLAGARERVAYCRRQIRRLRGEQKLKGKGKKKKR